MLTKYQAITANEFHADGCDLWTGPKGRVHTQIDRYRRNGKTQTWKTRPNEWRIPIKSGFSRYDSIWHTEANNFHTSEDCPLNKAIPC